MPKKTLNIQGLLLSSATPLTLADRRLYNYLLHHAFDELPTKLNFAIPLTALAGIYGSGAPVLSRLQESLRRLLRTVIEYETAGGEWQLITLLTKAEIATTKMSLSYRYSLECATLFMSPHYLEKCLIQAHFTQKYSGLLYEILASAYYQHTTQLSVEIADLRARLKIAPNKLVNFNDLDRFGLTPALAEINIYASFTVQAQTQRQGMKVTHVLFSMTQKRAISATTSAKRVIPPKRPRLFIDDPDTERAYAFLLNTSTKIRRRYFMLACKRAAKAQQVLDEAIFDRPDLWFGWIIKSVLKDNFVRSESIK